MLSHLAVAQFARPNKAIDIDYLALVDKTIPGLAATFNGRFSRGVPCPKCGGSDRFNFSRSPKWGDKTFCRHCAPKGMHPLEYVMWLYGFESREAIDFLKGMATKVGPARTEIKVIELRPLDSAMAEKHHATPDNGWRNYFHGRGITNQLIDLYQLGFNTKWSRYSIPNWLVNPTTGVRECWGIQYRIRPILEERMKQAGKKVSKYLSETGSHNQMLFNGDYVNRKINVCLVVEGVLDCITLRRYGIPACAAFQGNNPHKAWRTEWNKYLRNIGTVLIIPDNDASGMGELIALSKLNDIPRSRIHRLPDNFKDVGKLIESWLPTCDEKEIRKRLVNWLDPHGLGMFTVKRIDPDA